jgi:hypothetical protein
LRRVGLDRNQPLSMAKSDGFLSQASCRMTTFMPEHVDGSGHCGSPAFWVLWAFMV